MYTQQSETITENNKSVSSRIGINNRTAVFLLITIIILIFSLTIVSYLLFFRQTGYHVPPQPLFSRFRFWQEPIIQVCLFAPNSNACHDCRENGKKGETCQTCEDIIELKSKNIPLTNSDMVYYETNCSEPFPSTIPTTSKNVKI